MLLDEWQRLPGSWDLVRRAVDADPVADPQSPEGLASGRRFASGLPSIAAADRSFSMRIPRSLCLALVVGLVSSACATERTPVPAEPAQPSTTPDVALATTVPGGEVTEPQATTTVASASEPVVEEPPADIGEWTPERALAVLGDVCSQPMEGRGSFDDWTPRFWLLCNVVAVGPSGGVPDMWGFNAECVGDFLPGPDALSCIMDELVNYLIIDYQTWKLTGDPAGTWLLSAAEADLRGRCEHVVSSGWNDDELRDACTDYLSSLQALEPRATADALAGDAISLGPAPGDRLVVAAVESDDVLNVRDEPMGSIVAMLENIRGETEDRLWVLRPDSSVAAYLQDDAVVATGRARSLPRSTWYEVTVGGYTGWASAAYLAYPATVEDVTDEVTRAAGGLPEAARMDELARIVLDALEPRINGEPVTVSGPGWFEGLAEMEIDLVVRGSRHFGQRLYITADASIDWDDTLEIIDTRLRSATLQTLCSRGWNGERCL